MNSKNNTPTSKEKEEQLQKDEKKENKESKKQSEEVEEKQSQHVPNNNNLNELTELEKKINGLKQEKQELIEHLQRLQAEFENYKKRVEKEKNDFLLNANKNLIASLLPLLDNFELALKNTQNKEEFVKGVELIYSQFFSLLEDYGLKPIEATGKMFDANFHEALLTEKSELPENTIIEELQKGYLLNGKVLRTAKVKIAKK